MSSTNERAGLIYRCGVSECPHSIAIPPGGVFASFESIQRFLHGQGWGIHDSTIARPLLPPLLGLVAVCTEHERAAQKIKHIRRIN